MISSQPALDRQPCVSRASRSDAGGEANTLEHMPRFSAHALKLAQQLSSTHMEEHDAARRHRATAHARQAHHVLAAWGAAKRNDAVLSARTVAASAVSAVHALERHVLQRLGLAQAETASSIPQLISS